MFFFKNEVCYIIFFMKINHQSKLKHYLKQKNTYKETENSKYVDPHE